MSSEQFTFSGYCSFMNEHATQVFQANGFNTDQLCIEVFENEDITEYTLTCGRDVAVLIGDCFETVDNEEGLYGGYYLAE